jgi:hypothetical protein
MGFKFIRMSLDHTVYFVLYGLALTGKGGTQLSIGYKHREMQNLQHKLMHALPNPPVTLHETLPVAWAQSLDPILGSHCEAYSPRDKTAPVGGRDC